MSWPVASSSGHASRSSSTPSASESSAQAAPEKTNPSTSTANRIDTAHLHEVTLPYSGSAHSAAIPAPEASRFLRKSLPILLEDDLGIERPIVAQDVGPVGP